MTSGTTQATPGIVPGSVSERDGGDRSKDWLPPAADFGADLQSIPGCINEIEACNKGLAYLDHIYGVVLDNLSDAEDTWASVEAEAAREVRPELPNAATAVEVKGAITRWVEERRTKRQARDEMQLWRRRKEKVDRWMRTLEKRLSAAQSAQNGHEALGKYGGGV